MNPTDTAVSTVKVASALDHLKNNRIEYLLLMLVCHFIGVTDSLINYGAGVCA